MAMQRVRTQERAPFTKWVESNDFAVRKFGENDDVGAATAPEDMIAVGGSQYWPAGEVAAANINISSSLAGDDVGGIGASVIEIQGLDGTYRVQSENVALDGTTAVHPTKNYLRIFRAKVLFAGTSETNVGNITIADGSGVMAYIPIGYGQTQQVTYTIPKYHTNGAELDKAWLLSYNAGMNSRQSQAATLSIDIRPLAGAWRRIEIFTVSEATNADMTFVIPIPLDIMADMRMRVFTATANALPMSGGLELFIQAKDT